MWLLMLSRNFRTMIVEGFGRAMAACDSDFALYLFVSIVVVYVQVTYLAVNPIPDPASF